VNKKLIIITGIIGIVGFAASFGISFILGKMKKVEPPQDAQQQQVAADDQTAGIPASTGPVIKEEEKTLKAKLTEQQLQGLIHDVREKSKEYDVKMKGLQKTEERIADVQKSLQNDIESLNKLRIEIASLTAQLKQQRQKLLDTRIEIVGSEQENFQKMASFYDTMEPEGAADIFTNMSKLNTSESNGLDDVVKILYYMEDRNKAGVLAQLVTTEPKLAAVLSREMKKIKEVAQ
jgi:flagellar motility protein MotE (MotC chaperone)